MFRSPKPHASQTIKKKEKKSNPQTDNCNKKKCALHFFLHYFSALGLFNWLFSRPKISFMSPRGFCPQGSREKEVEGKERIFTVQRTRGLPFKSRCIIGHTGTCIHGQELFYGDYVQVPIHEKPEETGERWDEARKGTASRL